MLFLSILRDGLILSVLSSALLIIALYVNPRSFLQDYPEEIQALVPPKTTKEKRIALAFGIPFLILLTAIPLLSTFFIEALSGYTAPFWALFVNAFGVAFVFNLVDWLLLDWVMFCTITPKFVVIPGTEGHPAYKNYGFHFRGFLVGTALSAAAGFIFAGIVWLI